MSVIQNKIYSPSGWFIAISEEEVEKNIEFFQNSENKEFLYINHCLYMIIENDFKQVFYHIRAITQEGDQYYKDWYDFFNYNDKTLQEIGEDIFYNDKFSTEIRKEWLS